MSGAGDARAVLEELGVEPARRVKRRGKMLAEEEEKEVAEIREPTRLVKTRGRIEKDNGCLVA